MEHEFSAYNDECIDSTCRYCGLNLKQHEDKK